MNILIFPDIHGRTFWKETLKNVSLESYDKIVFLGDYLDPYDFEGITVEDAIANFEDIIDFKKANMEKVILLLGNHDIYYYFKKTGPSRYCYDYHTDIEYMFESNKHFFQLAYETDETLFTHSGYLTSWADYCNEFLKDKIVDPTAESLNSLLESENGKGALMMVGRSRGGYYPSGSCIWCDISEHQYANKLSEYKGKFQVFGHSLQLDLTEYYNSYKESDIKDGSPKFYFAEEGEINPRANFAMLDCRHSFEYKEGVGFTIEAFKQL